MKESRKPECIDEEFFIKEISIILYPQVTYEFEKACFEVLYNQENVGKRRADLITKLNKKKSINDSIKSNTRVSQIGTNIAGKIKQTFGGEMNVDIPDRINRIPNPDEPGKPGHPPKGNSPHEVASDWLWNYKYPRWLVDRGLDSLIADADKRSDWIDFNPIDEDCRGAHGHRRPQTSQRTIKLNTPFFMSIKLPNPDGYFWLLNRGFVTRSFFCPSLDFAPTNKVDGEEILIPHKDAECLDIFFDETGQEEFIGIWVDKELNLPWVQEESFPRCTPERINHLLAELSESQYQVFYKSFDVVKSS